MCITCRRLQSVGRFRERFIPKQSLSIFKVVIFKWNLTIIVLITKERWIMVCFSVIETQRKLQRSTQAAQRSTSLLGIWNVSNYIIQKSGQEISLKIVWVKTGQTVLQRIVCRIDRLNFIFNYHCKLQESSFERNAVIYPHIIISFIASQLFVGATF